MLRTFLTENVLSHTDSVAMDSSAELRLPYLDRDLVEFVLKLPASMRVNGLFRRPRTKRILNLWRGGRPPGLPCSPQKHTLNYRHNPPPPPPKGGLGRRPVPAARAPPPAPPGLDALGCAPPPAP